MLMKIFNTGTGGASGPINYLLGKDADGNERSIKPKILSGSKDAVAMLIDQNPHKNKYCSGVLAFRDDEKPTAAQMNQITEDFRNTFMPGMNENRCPVLWVVHQEKNSTEMHFVFSKMDSFSGRSFNAFPPGANNLALKTSFTQLQNDKLGFKQVRKSAFSVSFEAFEKKSRKAKLGKYLESRVKNGTIKNRNDLINYFKNELKAEITRVNDDYFSVKLSGASKAIRLEGEAFKKNANYQELIKPLSDSLTRLEKAEAIITSQSFVKRNSDFNSKRYSTTPKPKFSKGKIATKSPGLSKTSSKTSENSKSSSSIENIKQHFASPAPVSPGPLNLKERSEHAPATQPAPISQKTHAAPSGGSGRGSGSASLASFDSQIASLAAQISSTKDPAKKAELQSKINVLIAKKMEAAFKEKHDKEKQNSRIKPK